MTVKIGILNERKAAKIRLITFLMLGVRFAQGSWKKVNMHL